MPLKIIENYLDRVPDCEISSYGVYCPSRDAREHSQDWGAPLAPHPFRESSDARADNAAPAAAHQVAKPAPGTATLNNTALRLTIP